MNCVVYARYSSNNQREESIDAQMRACADYAARNAHIIVKVYADEAKSATSDNRPQFQLMMKECKSFDAVIVHKLDRFSRDRYDSSFYKRHLKKNDVKLISVLENIDGSPESIILESVLDGMAEYYSKNLAREVMKGLKEAAMKCKFTGGVPALGYDVNPDNYLIINTEEARIIKIIFEMYADGKSYGDILESLRGINTKAGRPFGKNSLSSLLGNEKYKGVYIYNKTTLSPSGKRNFKRKLDDSEIIKIEDGVPRIISDELWEKVQNRMHDNRHHNGAVTAKEVYLLSGKLFCSKCGGAMTGIRKYAGKNRKEYFAYECSTRKRTKSCDMKSIGKSYFEDKILNILDERVFNSNNANEMADRLLFEVKKRIDTSQIEIEIFKKDLSKTQKDIDNIVEAVVKGLYHESFKLKMDLLEQKKQELLFKITMCQNEAKTNVPDRKAIVAFLVSHQNIKSKPIEDQKRIVQSHITSIILSPDGQYHIDGIVTVTNAGKAMPFTITNILADWRCYA